jgi:hypothetical protein
MPGPLWGGTNNQRSYSGPTTGSAFDSRTIPDSQGGGNLGVMSFQFTQSQQQAGWDAMNNAPGQFPIANLPGPLLNPSNAWMTHLTPEAEQDLGYLLYGDLSGLTTPETGVLFADNGATSFSFWALLLGSAASFLRAAEQWAIAEGWGLTSPTFRDAAASANAWEGAGAILGYGAAVIMFMDPTVYGADDMLNYSSGGLVTIGVTPDGLPAISYCFSVGPTCSEIAPVWSPPNYGGE